MSYSAAETRTVSFDGPSVRGWAAAGSEWLAENVSRERKADKLSMAEAPVEPCLRKIPETYRSAAPLPVVESYSVVWKSPEFVRRTMSQGGTGCLSASYLCAEGKRSLAAASTAIRVSDDLR